MLSLMNARNVKQTTDASHLATVFVVTADEANVLANSTNIHKLFRQVHNIARKGGQ